MNAESLTTPRLRGRVTIALKRRAARVIRRIGDVDRTARWSKCWRAVSPTGFAVLCVYRAANSDLVVRLCEELPSMTQIRLWALDEPDDRLASWTVGTGPGLRLPLLNHLWSTLPFRFDGYVVISDDDVLVTEGTLGDAVGIAERSGFGLSQPAHDRWSVRSHRITEAHMLSLARATTFVEVGPVVMVAPAQAPRVFPLPDELGMGSGLETRWMSLLDDGVRLGIVDAVRVRHVGRPGAAYDLGPGVTLFHETLDGRGGYKKAVKTLATWHVWRRTPPW